MAWAVKLVDQICKVFSTDAEKSFFIQHLESTFSQVTREVFEHSAAGGGKALLCVTFSPEFPISNRTRLQSVWVNFNAARGCTGVAGRILNDTKSML